MLFFLSTPCSTLSISFGLLYFEQKGIRKKAWHFIPNWLCVCQTFSWKSKSRCKKRANMKNHSFSISNTLWKLYLRIYQVKSVLTLLEFFSKKEIFSKNIQNLQLKIFDIWNWVIEKDGQKSLKIEDFKASLQHWIVLFSALLKFKILILK